MESSTISKSKRKGKEEEVVESWPRRTEKEEEEEEEEEEGGEESRFPNLERVLPFIFRKELIRSYRIRQLLTVFTFFSPPFFGFITHARSTGPLASFTFLRASIIVRGGVAFDTDTFYYGSSQFFVHLLFPLLLPLFPSRIIVSTYFNFCFFPL